MITNKLFRECLDSVPEETRIEFEISFRVAERIAAVLTQKGITQRELAAMLGKRESEVSKWLTGRHNLTINTIARIQHALEEEIIVIPSSTSTFLPHPKSPAHCVADDTKIEFNKKLDN